MNRPRSYYDLFGISPQATSTQLRAAYLQLMKRHHPDVADTGATPPNYVALLGKAYKTLSDPVARSAYDEELARDERLRSNSLTDWSIAASMRQADRKFLWLASGVLACIVLAMISVLALGGGSSVERPEEYQSVPWLDSRTSPLVSDDSRKLAPKGAMHQAAQKAARLSPHEAHRRSTACFSAARDQRNFLAAQLCVVFDNAFLYARKTPFAVLPPYFDAQVVRMRHSSALEVEPNDPLLDELWRQSFAALLADAQSPLGGGGNTSTRANASATPGGLAPIALGSHLPENER